MPIEAKDLMVFGGIYDKQRVIRYSNDSDMLHNTLVHLGSQLQCKMYFVYIV